MTKTVVYRDSSGVRREKEFEIRGSRNSTGVHTNKDDETESILFAKGVHEYLASYFTED
jgi:hypothetical protein